MAEKYQNKYRIKSARLQNWDYGQNGVYFVTICTRNREYFFENIISGEKELSEIGKLAEKYWLEIPDHFPFVKSDIFVVMPNHVHGIIVIDKNNIGRNVVVETPNLDVSTTTPTPKSTTRLQTAHAVQKWKPATLGVIINQYKRAVTINARKISVRFAWQSRFYDHIIRNNNEYTRIVQYIINNPIKWEKDKLNGGTGNIVKEPTSEYNSENWMV